MRTYPYRKWPKRQRVAMHRPMFRIHVWELECGHGLIETRMMRTSRFKLGKTRVSGIKERSHCLACYEEEKRAANIMTKTITWTPEKLERFKRAFLLAAKKKEFKFEGHAFVRNYAKYLIEYLEDQLQ